MEREKEGLERRIDELESRNGNNNNNTAAAAAGQTQDKIKVNNNTNKYNCCVRFLSSNYDAKKLPLPENSLIFLIRSLISLLTYMFSIRHVCCILLSAACILYILYPVFCNTVYSVSCIFFILYFVYPISCIMYSVSRIFCILYPVLCIFCILYILYILYPVSCIAGGRSGDRE